MLLSIFKLANKLDLGWQDVYDLVEAGNCPEPVYVGNLARWREADIAQWSAAGCPEGQELSDENYGRLADAVLVELQAADEQEKELKV